MENLAAVRKDFAKVCPDQNEKVNYTHTLKHILSPSQMAAMKLYIVLKNIVL
jgi:hypothetical protein